jgi:tetratricopeptide (TPR) repeat protein
VDRAVELAAKAVKMAETEPAYWNTLGVAQYRVGNWEAAIQALQRSVKLQSNGSSADWFFLAMANWRLGKRAEGRGWYVQAVDWMERNKPDDQELRRFRDEALALWDKAAPEDAQHWKDWQNQRQAAAELARRAGALAARPNLHGDLEQALGLIRKAVQLEPGSDEHRWDLWNRICLAYYGPRDWEGAEIDARLAIKLASDKQSWASYLSDNLATRVAADVPASDRQSCAADFASYLAPFLLLAGKTEEYKQFCQRVLKDLPEKTSSAEAQVAARLCVLDPQAAGDPDAVLRITQHAADELSWVRFHSLGMAHCRAGHYEQAVEWLEKARESASLSEGEMGAAANWLGLAIANHHLGCTDDARQWFEKSRQLLDPALTDVPNGGDRMRLGVLRREAESLILGDKGKDSSNPK